MAQPANTHDSYDNIGQREDLSDMIWDVSPDDTPFLSAIKKNKATGVTHEWQTDALDAPAANAHIDGDDSAGTAITATARLNNYCQILKKVPIVSGTQEAVNKAGRKSEMAYQKARKMREIKTDLEWAMLDGGGAAGIGNAKAIGDSTTAREMASIQTYIITAASVGAGAGAVAAGTGANTMTAGTARAFTTTLLDGVLATSFTNGGNPNTLYVSPTNKGVVGSFTAGGATRYVTTDDSKLNSSVDVYVGDFHTLKVVPSRQMANEIVLCIDHDYAACSTLRPLASTPLAKTGDNLKEELLMECTLSVLNEKAHCIVADTNG
jgi:hypothetical protein